MTRVMLLTILVMIPIWLSGCASFQYQRGREDAEFKYRLDQMERAMNDLLQWRQAVVQQAQKEVGK